MINYIIKIDLHIHSNMSAYKEPSYATGESIVDNSNIENLDILFQKLLENEIELFSITDHNRLNVKLYQEIYTKLAEEKYQSLHVLTGVEFDVRFEEDKDITHIITIFNTSNLDDIVKIEQVLNENLLNNKSDFYTKNQYEKILKEIELEVILIVHQKCDMNRKSTGHNSLSEGTSNPYEIIQMGYISALEYQKPNVEGMLKSNLKDYDGSISLITGSDCHDWSVYPYHNRNSNSSISFSKIKALPSFKGLLLALTSYKTRFNRKSTSRSIITDFEINGDNIPLDPGINVIIGENGSGKSSLLSMLTNQCTEKHVKDLKRENHIVTKDIDENRLKYIGQSQIVNNFKGGDSPFGNNMHYHEIDNHLFELEYDTYSKKLKEVIDRNIGKNEKLEQLQNQNFVIRADKESKNMYYVQCITDFENNIVNPHRDRVMELKKILNLLKKEYDNGYYSESEKMELYNSLNTVYSLYKMIYKKAFDFDLNDKCRNIIMNKINDYSLDINELSTSKDQEIHDYKKNKREFITTIIEACKINNEKIPTIENPKIIKGFSKNTLNGFSFTKEAFYNQKDVLSDFNKIMFNKSYQSIDKIMAIKDKNMLKDAVSGCSSIDKIDEIWGVNLKKFKNKMEESHSYILEESSSDKIGNTMGEISLAYYKFQTSYNKEWDILCIDQPEDNISNNKIAEKLISYLNSLRDKKQIIIITHNPLLVVNLDADNIIHLNKNNNKIQVKAGCLEDDDNRILHLVAKTMDGGKEMIERRLKIYG